MAWSEFWTLIAQVLIAFIVMGIGGIILGGVAISIANQKRKKDS